MISPKSAKTKFIQVIIFSTIFFIPTYSFAQSIGITGQFGTIFLTAMRDKDFSKQWGIKGIIHSGGIITERSFFISEISKDFEERLVTYEVGFEFTYVEIKKATPSYYLTTSSELLATMVSIRIFDIEKYYLLLGVGRTWLYGYASIAIFAGELSVNDWAFQIGIGKDSTKDLRIEAKYLYGARNGNTGIIIGIGAKVNLF